MRKGMQEEMTAKRSARLRSRRHRRKVNSRKRCSPGRVICSGKYG